MACNSRRLCAAWLLLTQRSTMKNRAHPTLIILLVATSACGDSDSSSPDASTPEARACSEVVVSDTFADATSVGTCTSQAGLAIAESAMNLTESTIDNNGVEMTPCIEARCDDTYAYIISNGLPHYDFVQTTPNELAEDLGVFRVPLQPTAPAGTDAVEISGLTGCETAYESYISGVAPDADPADICADAALGYLTEDLAGGTQSYAQIPCLGAFGVLINGVDANGPNEAGFPDPFGDPAFRYPDDSSSGGAALDFCGGHTGGNMHYHATYEPCFETDEEMKPAASYADAVATWTQDGLLTDACTTESPILGWSGDGYPIKGPCVCLERDGNGDCTSVKRARSSWRYDGLGSHVAEPDAVLDLEGATCTDDDACCPDGTEECDLQCNYVLVEGSQAGTAVSKVCTLLDYSWCSSVYYDQTLTDTSAESFVYLDRCNGYDGADGFAYHATGSFPYLQGCYRGEPAEQAAGGMGPGMGPPGMGLLGTGR